jgi:transcriptional regulator with XRE-family HTH domain
MLHSVTLDTVELAPPDGERVLMPRSSTQPAAETLAPLASALGRATSRLRRHAGHSQEAFADAIGVHRTAMSAFERGVTDPKLGTLQKVARGLGISASELLYEAEREQKTGSLDLVTTPGALAPAPVPQRGEQLAPPEAPALAPRAGRNPARPRG